MQNTGIDVFIAGASAIIVMIDDKRAIDLAAGIDAKLEIRPLYLVAVTQRAIKPEQGFSVHKGIDAGICRIRPMDREYEINPDIMRNIGDFVKHKTSIGIGRGNFRKGSGKAKHAVKIANCERRFAGRIAKLRLVMPLRKNDTDARWRDETVRQLGGETIPGFSFKRRVVPVAQFSPRALRNMVALVDFKTAGLGAGANDLALDDR